MLSDTKVRTAKGREKACKLTDEKAMLRSLNCLCGRCGPSGGKFTRNRKDDCDGVEDVPVWRRIRLSVLPCR
jgi:hypothetical protein